ncbi:unnamed protein product [Phytophthora lilii]|uniref:Unnamed protein product n=1 Tax=Phytophthora lilii TaxID=2077276 RepID=A0A9W6UEW4_9STRA|nr:unnamed protein product [Phytophthora lilii]
MDVVFSSKPRAVKETASTAPKCSLQTSHDVPESDLVFLIAPSSSVAQNAVNSLRYQDHDFECGQYATFHDDNNSTVPPSVYVPESASTALSGETSRKMATPVLVFSSDTVLDRRSMNSERHASDLKQDIESCANSSLSPTQPQGKFELPRQKRISTPSEFSPTLQEETCSGWAEGSSESFNMQLEDYEVIVSTLALQAIKDLYCEHLEQRTTISDLERSTSSQTQARCSVVKSHVSTKCFAYKNRGGMRSLDDIHSTLSDDEDSIAGVSDVPRNEYQNERIHDHHRHWNPFKRLHREHPRPKAKVDYLSSHQHTLLARCSWTASWTLYYVSHLSIRTLWT